MARLNMRQKNYDEAENYYKQLLELTTDNPVIYEELGNLYFQTNQNKKSEECYNKAIEMRPKSAESAIAKYNYSIVLLEEGKLGDALQYAWQAYDEKGFVKDDKNKSNIIYNYALILEKNGKLTEAKKRYREVMEINQNHEKTKINLSAILMEEDDCDVDYVLDLLNSVYDNDKDGFEVNNNLGTAYVIKKNYSKAIFHYEKAAQKTSDSSILSNLGNAYLENGDLDDAMNIYEKLIKQDESNWNSFVNLGKIYLQKGELDKSLKMLLHVQKNAPQFRKAEVESLIEILYESIAE